MFCVNPVLRVCVFVVFVLVCLCVYSVFRDVLCMRCVVFVMQCVRDSTWRVVFAMCCARDAVRDLSCT